ncbi:MAG: FecR domain-containing protein [Deltaproteobacteria bacterium]|nr:FecR domain-containing protein [Deltaproteobacteria bacterium]
MSRTCEEHCAELIAHLAGELPVLEGTRLEAHLAHCAECRQVQRTFSLGFAAARDVPEVTSAEIEQRVLEVEADPILEVSGAFPRPRQRTSWAAPMALAASVAVVAVGIGLRERLLPPAAPVVVVAPAPAPAPAPVVRAPVAPIEQQASPFVRLVHGDGFRGTVSERAPGDTLLVVDQGAVAVAFAGGQGRRLHVEAGDVVIDVTGTRFSVERDLRGVTVSVRSGQVDVRVGFATHSITALQTVRIEAGTVAAVVVDAAAFAWADRAFLRDGEHHVAAPVAVVAPPVVVAPVVVAPVVVAAVHAAPTPKETTGALLEVFAAAEDRAYAGDRDGARALYRRAATEPAFRTKRALAEFELGRFLAVVDKDREAARPVLAALAHGESNVAGDAALLVCQLDEASDPCAAEQCLAALVDRAGDVGRDAAALRTRLKTATRCESQK